MKCVIAFSCLLAVASAGYLGNGVAYTSSYAAPLAYSTAYAAPIAYAAPRSFGYQSASVHPVGVGYTGYGYAAPVAHAYAAPLALASQAREVDPVAIAAGAPLPTGDTVEVAAAKAVHFQAHAAAKGLGYSAISPALAYSGYAASPIAYSGYARSVVAPIAYSGYAHAGLASEARLIDPVAIAAGAPLPTGDTVEVAAAKAFHHQAHVEAKTGHLLAKGHFIAKRSPGYLNAGYAGYAAPLAYATPARSYGYSAYSSPLAYSGYSGYGYGGHLGAYYG